MNVVLISTYELGHQPFGLASPAAWLRARGAQVTCLDLSRQPLQEQAVRHADLVAFYVPMHTATRLAARLIAQIRTLNPRAHLCFYGLYAPVNEDYLRGLGVGTILGGEFEGGLARLVEHLADNNRDESPAPVISLERLNFIVPDRAGLPPLGKYAHVLMPDGASLVAGYTEASRGCKHLCRHCPIVPVYGGVFRVVQREVVLEDIRRQVAAGAQHISFGDPDFFNGPAHGLAIVEALHREFPQLSYDVTIKVEHLLQHAPHLPRLRDTGCLFVTSAVESVDDAILQQLDKGHTRADFLAVVAEFRRLNMILHPTFVPFTPWTTLEGYADLLAVLAEQELVENVAPIQLGIRLLIPAGSRLLELDEARAAVDAFDPAALVYPWRHSDPRMDQLAARVQELAASADKTDLSRAEAFAEIWRAVSEAHDQAALQPTKRAHINQSAVSNRVSPALPPGLQLFGLPPALSARAAIPHLSEAWYCCAEPTQEQFVAIAGACQPAVVSGVQAKLQPETLGSAPDAFV